MKVKFGLKAVGDLERIIAYISLSSPRAARRVAKRIRSASRRLSQFPFSGRSGEEPGTREGVVSGLPYLLIYRIVETKHVDVIAVIHMARDRAAGRAG